MAAFQCFELKVRRNSDEEGPTVTTKLTTTIISAGDIDDNMLTMLQGFGWKGEHFSGVVNIHEMKEQLKEHYGTVPCTLGLQNLNNCSFHALDKKKETACVPLSNGKVTDFAFPFAFPL